MVSDLCDELHRVIASRFRMSLMIDDAKVHIKSMQNKPFSDMFQIYFSFEFESI